MKIVRMNTSSFWKGEAGGTGLVVDQGTPHYLFDETDNARVKSFLSKIL